MAERYEFRPQFEDGEKGEKKEEFSLWEEPLSEEEISEFFHEIKRIREEGDAEIRRKEMERLLPHLLGKRCEEKLRERGKKLVEIECEGGEEILKSMGYEWFAGENEEKQGLEIRRAVIEKEQGNMKKMRTNTVIFSGEEIEAMTGKFLREIKELKKEDLWRIEEEKRKIRGKHKKFKGSKEFV